MRSSATSLGSLRARTCFNLRFSSRQYSPTHRVARIRPVLPSNCWTSLHTSAALQNAKPIEQSSPSWGSVEPENLPDDLLHAQVAYMGAKKCYIRLDRRDTKVHLAYVSASVWRNKETSKIVVGDGVLVKRVDSQNPEDSNPNFRVLERLPRTNLFQRSNEDGDKIKELAANVDQLVIVSSFGLPPFSSIVLDRVLVASLHAKISPVIVLNKLDLAEDSDFQSICSTYTHAGFPVIGTSIVDGRGLESMKAALEGKTSALYGITGAGKSSLVNAITKDVVSCYPEFVRESHNCALGSRCSHLHESVEACAVKQAVRDGTIATQRYTSFAHMMLELEDAM